jgi:hypothetical protein
MLTQKDFESWDLWNDFCDVLTQYELAAEKKKELKRRHDAGEPRPYHKTKEGKSLRHYICKTNNSFDLAFRESIPNWLKENVHFKMKQEFLEMAKNGEDKPYHKIHPMFHWFTNPNPKNKLFDAEFVKQIKKLAPKWIDRSIDRNKKQLLEMAKKGLPRPKHNSKLGSLLSTYTLKSCKMYDAEFATQINTLRPDWFISQSDRVRQKKQKFLRMARNGEDKSKLSKKEKTQFGQYVTPNGRSYDPTFMEQMKIVGPIWFVGKVEKNKQQLLEMAKNGEDKPKSGEPLASEFRIYTRERYSYYCSDFTKEIKKLAPEWLLPIKEQRELKRIKNK